MANRTIEFPIEEAIQMYEDGLSLSAIARELCVSSYKTIRQRLAEAGVVIDAKRRRDQLAEKNTSWKGGGSRATAWRRTKELRKNGKCAICETRDNLEVHHKDKNRANNDPSNLVVLCKQCHAFGHSLTRTRTATGQWESHS